MTQVGGFGNDGVPSAQSPVQDDLCLTTAMLGSHGLNDGLLRQVVTSWSHLGAESTEWTVGDGGDAEVVQELYMVGLRARRIQADLVGHWLVLGIGHNVCEELSVEVRHGKAFAETLVHEAFHASPKDVQRHLRSCEEVVGPVQVVHVDVVCLEGLETLPESGLGISVAIVPELRGKEDVFASDGASRDRLLNTLANLSLVHCDCSCVNVPVANVSNGMSDSFRVLVEQSTESHGWHLTPVAECYCFL